MQYKWAKVVDLFRDFAQKRTRIQGSDPNDTAGRVLYFKEMMYQTDIFYPWNNDGELSRALDKMPKYCNYRSLKSYWAWKNGKEAVYDACFSILEEMENTIQEWHDNTWNHAPGYKAPEKIEFNGITDDEAVKLGNQIIAHCQKVQRGS